MSSDVLIIKDVTHEHLFAALITAVCLGIMAYNVFCLVYHILRVKKLREAGKLITEGHQAIKAKRKDIVIDGKVLDDNFILDQIGLNRKKIKKKEENSAAGRKRAEIAAKKTEKARRKADIKAARTEAKLLKQSEAKNAMRLDTLLDGFYEASDAFDMHMQSFYASYDTSIRDQKVREAVRLRLQSSKKELANEKKRRAKLDKEAKQREAAKAKQIQKKEKHMRDNTSVRQDINIFD